MKLILLFIFVAATGVAQADPNHLLPVPAYDDEGYDQAVFKTLIGDGKAEIWMVVKPSFKEEYAIILRREREYEYDVEGNITYPYKLIRDEWVLSRVSVKQKIWAFKEFSEGRLMLDVKPTDNVVKHSIVVNKHDYERIITAWKVALKTTRYPDDKGGGLDGTTYQFYAHYNFFGETKSPKEGLDLIPL